MEARTGIENFRNSLRKRLIFNVIFLIIAIIVLVTSYVLYADSEISTQAGFVAGLFFGGSAVGMISNWKGFKALKDDRALKLMYIEENDERKKFISSKIAQSVLPMTMLSLAIAGAITMIAVSRQIGLIIIGTVVYMDLLIFIAYIYYNRKL